MLRVLLLPTALMLSLFTATSYAQTIDIESSAAWRTIATAPPSEWNTLVGFDDSDAAGWQSAFKSPTANHIWITSNMSGQSPNQAWFRFVFNVPNKVTAVSGNFFFDDDGEAYINGQQVVSDNSGGSTTVDLPTMDPNLFVVGSNLMAVHGIDKIAPFSNIGVSLKLTLVPEPIVMPLILAGGLLARRR